jgi:hypothetical protein
MVVGFAAMFGGVAIAAGWGAIGEFDHNRHLGASASVAEATVVQVHHSGHGRYTGRPRGDVVVKFRAVGRQVRAKVSFHYWQLEPAPSVGDPVTVRYDPDDPAKYVRDDQIGPSNFNALMLGVISLITLIGTIIGTRRILSD